MARPGGQDVVEAFALEGADPAFTVFLRRFYVPTSASSKPPRSS